MFKGITRIVAILFFTFTFIMLITEITKINKDSITIGYSLVALWMTGVAYFNSKKKRLDNSKMML